MCSNQPFLVFNNVRQGQDNSESSSDSRHSSDSIEDTPTLPHFRRPTMPKKRPPSRPTHNEVSNNQEV